MPSTLSHAAYALSTLSALATLTSAHAHDRSLLSRSSGTLRPRADQLSAMTYVGCFSSSNGLSDQGPYQYQTSGYCQPICVNANHAVLGLSGGSNCWCGDALPPASAKVDDSKCNVPCQGYGSENCGGQGFWSVYLDGLSANVGTAGGDASTSQVASTEAPTSAATSPAQTSDASTAAPAATTASPSVVTSVAPGHTVVVTEQPAAQATTPNTPSQSGGGKSNTAGIAAGVVVGIVAIAAIIGGVYFFLRRRKAKAAEDEYNRSKQVGDFMRGASEIKPPQTAYSQMSDSRLEPSVGKRNSFGSIADAGDYSRKILRVANPDGSN